MLLGSAVAWGLVIVYLAVALPVYTVDSDHAGLQPRHSLVRVFGYRVLLLAAIPLAVSMLVALLLRLRSELPSHWPAIAASILAWLTLIGAFVGMVTFLIGIFVLPIGVLLCLATGTRYRTT